MKFLFLICLNLFTSSINSQSNTQPLPIDFSLSKNKTFKTNFRQGIFSDVSTCSCDLSKNCDVNCCCDPDCSSVQKNNIFNCDVNYQQVPSQKESLKCSNLQIWRNSLGKVVNGNSQGGFCLVFENNPLSGFFYSDPEYVTTEAQFLETSAILDYTYDDSVNYYPYTALNQNYRYGEDIQIYFWKINVTSYLSLPSSYNGICQDSSPAKFLIEEKNTCSRYVTDPRTSCSSNGELSAGYYLTQDFFIRQLGSQIVFNVTDFNPLTPNFDNNTNTCSDYLQSLEYDIQYNSTGQIVVAKAFATYGNISLNANSLVQQQFSINFTQIDANASVVDVPRSGNFGYNPFSPILVGKLTTSSSDPTKQAIEYYPDPNSQLSIPASSFDPNSGTFTCSWQERLPVEFNQDVKTGCFVRYSMNDLTNNCDTIRKNVYELQMGKMNTLNRVGVFGNSSMYDVSDWITIFSNVPPEVVGDQPSVGNIKRTGICSDLLTHIHIQVLTYPIGSISSSDPLQEIIVGLQIKGTSGEFRFTCFNAMDCRSPDLIQSYQLSSSVEFISLAKNMYHGYGVVEMVVPPTPRLLPPLPDDLFYPLKIIR